MGSTAPTRTAYQIPRSAIVVETLTLTPSDPENNTILIERLEPKHTHASGPIQWLRWTVTYPDGGSDRWATRASGGNIAKLAAELDQLESDSARDPDIASATRAAHPRFPARPRRAR